MRGELRSEAFLQQAMRAHGDAVYRIALSQTGSSADAGDIYQDVFLGLLKDKTEFENDAHLKAWLLRVAVNKCRDLLKSAAKNRNIPLDESHDSSPGQGAHDEDVWDYVAKLPEEMREVIHLHYLEGYSTDEIAAIVNCRPQAVRTRMHRARAYLQEILPDHYKASGKEGSDE